MTTTTLARYCGTLDEERIDDALQLLDPDVRKGTDGGATTGRSLAAVRLGPDSLVASYQVGFHTEHVLVEDR